MCIRMVSQKPIQIAQQPTDTLIHTVSNEMFNVENRVTCFVDVAHGPQTNNITNRHVGDLGNLTSDNDGTVIVNMNDTIIDLYNTTRSILNRTMIIHAMLDDGGYTNVDMSNTTG